MKRARLVMNDRFGSALDARRVDQLPMSFQYALIGHTFDLVFKVASGSKCFLEFLAVGKAEHLGHDVVVRHRSRWARVLLLPRQRAPFGLVFDHALFFGEELALFSLLTAVRAGLARYSALTVHASVARCASRSASHSFASAAGTGSVPPSHLKYASAPGALAAYAPSSVCRSISPSDFRF